MANCNCGTFYTCFSCTERNNRMAKLKAELAEAEMEQRIASARRQVGFFSEPVVVERRVIVERPVTRTVYRDGTDPVDSALAAAAVVGGGVLAFRAGEALAGALFGGSKKASSPAPKKQLKGKR